MLLVILIIASHLFVSSYIVKTNKELRQYIHVDPYVSRINIETLAYSFVRNCKLGIVRIRDSLRSGKEGYI